MGVKRKSINNSGISKKLRKIDGVFNQKTLNKSPNTSAKKRQTPKKINANKSPKKNKKIPENTYEGNWKVEVSINEESFSGDFEDSEDSIGAVNQKTPIKSPKTPAKIQTPKRIIKSAKTSQKKNILEEDEEQMEVNLNEDSDEENVEDSEDSASAVNQKTPIKSPKTAAKIQTPKRIKKSTKTSQKKNKNILEEDEEQMEVNFNEDSDEENVEDSEYSASAVYQKTPNKSPKTPAKIPTPKKIKKSAKKNIPEEDEEQMQVNLNEDSDEGNLEDSIIASVDEQESDSDEDENEDEQNDSDEVIKQPSPKKQMVFDRNKFTVYVTGLRGTDLQIPDIFKDCRYTYYRMLKNQLGNLTGAAFVNFDEEENYKKALEKNGTIIKGVTIYVVPKRNYNIFVGNLNPLSKIERIFPNCKIAMRKTLPPTKSFLLCMEDEDSIQKALEKNQTEHDGCTIIVQREDCSGFVKEKEEDEQPSPKKQMPYNENIFTVYVDGLQEPDFRISDIFKDCNYRSYKLFKNERDGKIIGSAFVDFDDEENYKKALAKNETEINGVTITVESDLTKEDANHIFNIYVGHLNRNLKIENIFPDCKIVRRKMYRFSNSALLEFEDEDSIQKALEKDQTEHEGTKIIVKRMDCSVFVNGITNSFKPDEFFSNCKIRDYKLRKNVNTGEIDRAVVEFVDIPSYKNALAISGTKLGDKVIYVQSFVTIAEKKLTKQKPFFNKNAHKPFNKYTNTPFNNHTNTPLNKYTNRPFNKYTNTPFKNNTYTPFRKNMNTPFKNNTYTPFRKNMNTPFKRNTETFVSKNTNSTIAKNNE